MPSPTHQTIEIDQQLFERLQNLAEPLVDSPSSVIQKLLDHWEQNPPSATQGDSIPRPWWVSSRGERLPVDLKLRATYNGHTYHAVVRPKGIFFESEIFTSPSAAAIHAKNLEGLTGAAANTNGWSFWEYFDEETESWKPLQNLRRR